MPARKIYRRRPATMAVEEAATADGYHELVVAVIHLAISDARQDRPPVRGQPEARMWLLASPDAATLIELTGLDAAPVLARLRQALGS